MALVNGPTFAEAIDDPESELAKLEAATPDDAALVNEVFVRLLGREPTVAELTDAQAVLAAPSDDHDQAAAAFAARVRQIEPGFDAWRKQNRPVSWTPLKPAETAASMGAQLEVQDDASIFSSGAAGKGTYKLTAPAPLERIRGLRIEALADDRLGSKGPGRAANGNFVLNEVRLFVAAAGAEPRKVKLRTAEADYNQPGYHVSGAIDGSPETGWAVGGGTGANHTAVFSLARPLRLASGQQLVLELEHQFDELHLLGRFRVSVTADEPPLMPPDFGDEIRPLLAADYDKLDAMDQARLRDFFLSRDPEYVELKRAQHLLANPRLAAVQDLAWALINSPAFLFNH